MRLLVITNQFPLPRDMGGPLRIFGLMNALAAAHDVHVLAVRRPDTTNELIAELGARIGARVESFAAPPRADRGTLQASRRWALSVRAGMPPWVLAQFHRELCARAIALAPSVDAVVLLDDYAGAYAPWLAPLAPLVGDKHQVAGWASPGCSSVGSAAALWRGAPARANEALGRHLTRRFERMVAATATAVAVTSEEEAGRFEALYGLIPNSVPNAVELPPVRGGRPWGRRIGWIGTHAYRPNTVGLIRFVRGGWDRIGADGLELLIAGGNPPAEVRALESYAGVRILGFVDDLDTFMSGLTAAVVPLWDGAAGAKLKTLTLMGAGVPLAGTPVAVEATGAEDSRHCLIADEPAGLAAGLRSIIDDTALAARLSAGGRRLVRDGFTWESVGPRFVELVESVAREGPRPSRP